MNDASRPEERPADAAIPSPAIPLPLLLRDTPHGREIAGALTGTEIAAIPFLLLALDRLGGSVHERILSKRLDTPLFADLTHAQRSGIVAKAVALGWIEFVAPPVGTPRLHFTADAAKQLVL